VFSLEVIVTLPREEEEEEQQQQQEAEEGGGGGGATAVVAAAAAVDKESGSLREKKGERGFGMVLWMVGCDG